MLLLTRTFIIPDIPTVYIDSDNYMKYETRISLILCTDVHGNEIGSPTEQALVTKINNKSVTFEPDGYNMIMSGIYIPHYFKPICKFINVYYTLTLNHRDLNCRIYDKTTI